MPSRSSKLHKSQLSRPSVANDINGNSLPITSQSKPATSATSPTLTYDSSLPSPTPPQNWPPSLPYLSHPIISPYLPPSHLKWLRHRPQDLDLPTITFPLSQSEIESRVEIRLIDDSSHPACGQRGLFADRDLRPEELVVVYLGYVHGGTKGERGEYERQMSDVGCNGIGQSVTGLNGAGSGSIKGESTSKALLQSQSRSHNSAGVKVDFKGEEQTIGCWDTSSYDLNMFRDEDIEIAVDAADMGNEARFVNDYRGVPVSVSVTTTTHANDINDERRQKRKVKVKRSELEYQDIVTTTAAGTEEDRGAWQTSWHEKNSGNIAMPNAEFRDVWFDIHEDVDLSMESLRSDVLRSVPAEGQGGNVAQRDNELPSAEYSPTPKLDNLHLDERSQEQDAREMREHGHPQRRKRRPGVRGVAIFVMPAGKSGKRKHGIKKGQEILVSYGKGFWAHH